MALKLAAALAVLAVGLSSSLVVAADVPGGASTAPATEVEREPTKEVLEAVMKKVDQGIELLEADKVKEAIELLAPPDVLKRVKEKDYDKFVEEFRKNTAKELLESLKHAKTQKATTNAEGTRVKFPGKEKVRAIVMDKQADGWYLSK